MGNTVFHAVSSSAYHRSAWAIKK